MPQAWSEFRAVQSYSERTNTDHFIKSNICINLGFPGGSEGKESACNAGVLG